MLPRLPAGHPAESTEYRTRFRQAAVLLGAYRLVGTAAAVSQFWTKRDSMSSDLAPIWGLVALYLLYSIGLMLWMIELPPRWRIGFVGRGSRAFLDYRWAPHFDLTLASALSLMFAHFLLAGAAYEQAADLFAVAMITSATLWTGRYGRKLGACCLLIALMVEVSKAPINGVAIGAISWGTVTSRLLWVMCGVVVARGIVVMISGWADAVAARTIGESVVEKSVIVHDFFKWGLSRAREHLRSSGPSDERVEAALREIQVALAAEKEAATTGEDDVAACVARAVADTAKGAQRGPRIEAVDGVGTQVWVRSPRQLVSILRNGLRNAVEHSCARQVTIRWTFVDEWLALTVRDDGIGMAPDAQPGTGISQSHEAARVLGGELAVTHPSRGVRWVLHVPARTDRMERVLEEGE